MNNTKIQTLKGFRDFFPEEMKARDYVAKKIVETFKLYGFEPFETPTLEYSKLLLGKYGKESDKLVYTFEDKGGRKVGLRYDQTVPIARVLALYNNRLPKYFRRYQIQNVFRADKPQKGRYREFTQCDVDIFGSKSAISDAEVLACTYFAYKNVGFPNVEISINDRKTLVDTLSKFTTNDADVFSIIQSVDKLEKIGEKKVIESLVNKSLSEESAKDVLSQIAKTKKSKKLSKIIKLANALGIPEKDINFVPTLARGLDYYTDMIFEITIPEYKAGSVGGGGRYDNLIQQLGGVKIPAVGVAFGFDRMVEAAIQLGLTRKSIKSNTRVLVLAITKEAQESALKTSKQLRENGVNTQTYPAVDKLQKQLKYANQTKIPWVVIIGDKEVENNNITLKNLKEKTQETLSIKDALKRITSGT